MPTAQQLINFICIGATLLLLTIPMHWIRHRTFQKEGVESNARGFCVSFTLLFWVLWLILTAVSEHPLQAILNAAFLGTLLWMAEIDARCQILPDTCNLMIFVISIARQLLLPQGSIWSGLLGCVIVSVPMLLLSILVNGAFGGGDIKLTFAWGFFLGWRLSLLAFFLAVLIGGVYAVYLLAAGKKERKEHFAFGPFLCIGAMAATLWGESLIHWYLGLF